MLRSGPVVALLMAITATLGCNPGGDPDERGTAPPPPAAEPGTVPAQPATEPPAAAVDESQKAQACGNGSCSGKETCSTCPHDCGPCRFCGDGACNGDETCATCASDCGTCPTFCGDGSCNAGETCDACAADCGACPAVCGDTTCNGDETCITCAGDCGACPSTPVCGDGSCNGGETCSTCAGDCGACAPTASCGDGSCNGTETCTTCAGDCGSCPSATGRIAFTSDRTGTDVIYLANPDGSGVTPLTTGGGPAWSADGRKIAFYRSGTGIWVIDASGTNERFLRAGGGPTWSPDGTKIAYQSGSQSDGGIFVMDADGTNPRLLISHEFAADGWSLDYGVFSAAWSPDGRTIAFVSANYEYGWGIHTMNADGSGTPSGAIGGEADPAWSPDGSRIAFYAFGRDGYLGALNHHLASIAFPIGDNRDLRIHVSVPESSGFVEHPAWSPDGRSLLFARSSPPGSPRRIFIVREDGSVGQLIPAAQSPAKADYWDREPAWSWAD